MHLKENLICTGKYTFRLNTTSTVILGRCDIEYYSICLTPFIVCEQAASGLR